MRSESSSFLRLVFLLALTPVASATTTWYVNGVSGSDTNNCVAVLTPCKTIGNAISRAAAGDFIRVAAATYKENLSIGQSLTITGATASTTIIDGGGANTVVRISSTGAHVTLSNLTISNGKGVNSGGGVWNIGTLIISNSTIKGNVAPNGGSGGGIENGGTLTVNNSLVSGNSASTGTCKEFCLAWGGGIFNSGSLTINRSTVLKNSARDGGGIFNQNQGFMLTINNSTLSGNSAIQQGGGLRGRSGISAINNSTLNGNSAGAGGGIFSGDSGSTTKLTINNSTLSGNGAVVGGGLDNYTGSTVEFQNSIVANSTSGGNCSGTTASMGYNLSSDSTCHFNGPRDLNNIDPMLGPLENNGGPTQTMALAPASPAVDAGNPNGCTNSNGVLLKTDQRGMPRPDAEEKVGCDIGAYEHQSAPSCIHIGSPCFGPGQLKCCPAPFPHHSFCSNQTGWGTCMMN